MGNEVVLEVCTLNDVLEATTQKLNLNLPCSTVVSAKILETSYMYVEVILKKNEVQSRIVMHTSSRIVSERLVSMLMGGEFERQILVRLYLFGTKNDKAYTLVNKSGVVVEDNTQYIWAKIREFDKSKKNFFTRERHLGKVVGFYFGDRDADAY